MRVTRKDSKIDALRQAVRGLDGTQGRVGWFPSAVYEKGQPVAGIAAVHEFGSPARNIPPRLGMRAMAIERAQDWRIIVENVSRAAARGQIAPNRVMQALTMAAEGDMRLTISRITSPPLKASTVEARRKRLANGGVGAKASIAKPLVDTGLLLNSLTSEVTE